MKTKWKKNGATKTLSPALPTIMFGAVMFCSAMLSTAHAADATGAWLNEDKDAIVQIVDCAVNLAPAGTSHSPAPNAVPSSGALCGTVIWLKNPFDPSTGAPAADKNNKNPALRGRPVLGLKAITNMRPANSAGQWEGRVYDVDGGKTYEGSMILKSDDELRVQGCILLVCQGETFTRTSAPSAATPAAGAPSRPVPARAAPSMSQPAH